MATEPEKDETQDVPEPESVEASVIDEAEEILENAAESEDTEEASEDQLEAAKQEAKDWQDKYLRLHAEWDTYRRRMREQREEEKLRAAEKLVKDLIPVADDFDRTLSYADKNGTEQLLDGVKAVYNKFTAALEKGGVEILDPAGEPYDALAAQAVGVVDNPDVPDETVAQVFQKGYRMGSKVLRPAMVTVTTGGPKRETSSEDEQE